MSTPESQLVDTLELERQFCPYYKSANAGTIIRWMENDASRLREALVVEDPELVEKHFAKLYWSVWELHGKLEDQGFLSRGPFEQGIIEHLKKHKPNIFEGKSVSIEEAKDRFYESLTNG